MEGITKVVVYALAIIVMILIIIFIVKQLDIGSGGIIDGFFKGVKTTAEGPQP